MNPEAKPAGPFRNVGTPSYPVTWLHERAVALLWDELMDGLESRHDVFARLESGELSGNLLDGVERLDFPDDLTPIGGMYPDLALYDANHRPIRTIEVVVTSPPDKNKVEALRNRGVDVAVLRVRSEDDLKRLVWAPARMSMLDREYRFQRRPYLRGQGVNSHYEALQFNQATKQANATVDQLAGALLRCDPQYRRVLLSILRELDSLESYHPLRHDNPLKAKLRETAVE